MEENYVYPILVNKEKGVYNITFPDFKNAATCTVEEDAIIATAQDYLAITILDLIQAGEEPPKPTPALANATYIHIWLPYFKNKVKETYVKKTLTIPQWLNILAQNNNVNFSAALVRGIKEELNLK